jgi:hypothetical protein
MVHDFGQSKMVQGRIRMSTQLFYRPVMGGPRRRQTVIPLLDEVALKAVPALWGYECAVDKQERVIQLQVPFYYPTSLGGAAQLLNEV